MNPRPWLLVLAIMFLLVLAGPAAAADRGQAIFAGGYWDACAEYWAALMKKQNGVVIAVLAVGVVALFIITRSGKWQK
jgi:hypothetical protein